MKNFKKGWMKINEKKAKANGTLKKISRPDVFEDVGVGVIMLLLAINVLFLGYWLIVQFFIF